MMFEYFKEFVIKSSEKTTPVQFDYYAQEKKEN